MKLAAALLLFGCLIPALAQGPQGLEGPAPAPIVRDPFVYSLRTPEQHKVTPRPIVAYQTGQETPSQPTPPIATKPAPPAPAPKPVAPAVTVTGIVSGPGQTAILSNAGRSYVVRVGDRVGDYRVSAIGPRSVMLATGVNSFKLAMQ